MVDDDDGGGFQSRSGAHAAGPFSPALNKTLAAAFDAPLAGIQVVRGVDQELASVGANATTSGNTISLSSSITEDTADPRSMRIIAHEVAHALSGPGAGTTLIDQPGDQGELAADAAGLAFGHFAEDRRGGPVPKLKPAYGGKAEVHRDEISAGPGGVFHHPVHETVTAETLKRAGMIDKSSTFKSADAWEYTRGVVWNDDPTGLLFNDQGANGPTNNYSSAAMFLGNFGAAEMQAEGGRQFGQGDSMLARGHFGDMQFLHGMAPDGERPELTKQKMMMWAELTTQIAEGKITGDAKLSELALKNPQYKALLGSDPSLKDTDVNKLFGIGKPNLPLPMSGGVEGGPGGASSGAGGGGGSGGGHAAYRPDLQKRALGSLLHMVQDSYTEGHVQREDLGLGRRGAIENFHAYGHQDHKLHGEADGVPEGAGGLLNNVLKKPGKNDALDEGTVIAKMIKERKPVEEVLAYLDTHTFAVAKNATFAAPGENFKKAPEPDEPVPKVRDYTGGSRL